MYKVVLLLGNIYITSKGLGAFLCICISVCFFVYCFLLPQKLIAFVGLKDSIFFLTAQKFSFQIRFQRGAEKNIQQRDLHEVKYCCALR